MSNEKRKWVPEIFYEEEQDGVAGNLPFIQVPNDKEMPGVLFVFASSETGEFEPGLSGEPVPIVDLELHQYANMNYLKDHPVICSLFIHSHMGKLTISKAQI